MTKLGLIGYPLGHSFSRKYFSTKFEQENLLQDYVYENFEIDAIAKLPEIIAQEPSLKGLNVTIPYKEQVIPFLDELDPVAEAIGAVNTIKITRSANGVKLKGYNTDAYGFGMSIKPFLASHHEQALILGTGGASKAIAYVLRELGITCHYATRTPRGTGEFSYAELNDKAMEFHKLIVNCTPLGTFPNVEASPDLPYEGIQEDHLLYDLIYNPEETVFLKHGKRVGAQTINGLNMLKLQAEKAWEIWTS